MTITQTIDIPADRRITLPSEVPAGATARVEISWRPKEMDTTEFLMSNPVNRERISKAIKNIEEGKNLISFASIEDASKHAKLSNKLDMLRVKKQTPRLVKKATKLAEKIDKLVIKDTASK